MPREDRPQLSRDVILRTAVQLADADGVGAVTMRALAGRLGVEAMSLYHHVANKQDLLDGMVDHVFAEIDLPRTDRDWRPEIRRRCLAARQALARHAWAVGLLDARAAPGPNTLRHHDAVMDCLRAGGFSVRLAAHAFAVLDAHLYGSVLRESALPFAGSEPATGHVAGLAGTSPSLTEVAEQLMRQRGSSFGAEFEYGLDLILDGLEQRRASQARVSEAAAPARSTAPGTFLWAPAPS